MPIDDNPTRLEGERLAWTLRVRPGALGAALVRLLRLEPPRLIAETRWGGRLYVDPLSNLGREVVANGEYEPRIARVFQALIRPGAVVVDVGANEGALACLAGKLAGPEGRVIAVEPQRRLLDILEINRVLNGLDNLRIEAAALSPEPSADIWLFPQLNTGASSIVRRYRWSGRRQRAATISFAELMRKHDLKRLDLIKVDVEGYEKEVVDSLAEVIGTCPIGHLLVDYHAGILRGRGVAAADLDAKLRGFGLRPDRGELAGYVIYEGPP
jgi:FkbM family methyltransferase